MTTEISVMYGSEKVKGISWIYVYAWYNFIFNIISEFDAFKENYTAVPISCFRKVGNIQLF